MSCVLRLIYSWRYLEFQRRIHFFSTSGKLFRKIKSIFFILKRSFWMEFSFVLKTPKSKHNFSKAAARSDPILHGSFIEFHVEISKGRAAGKWQLENAKNFLYENWIKFSVLLNPFSFTWCDVRGTDTVSVLLVRILPH